MKERSVRKQEARHSRAVRVRKGLRGTALKPRLSVHKSNRNIFVQLIDDECGITLAGVGTLSKEFRNTEFGKRSKEAASALGKRVAGMAKEKGIETVVFDRGRFKYTGTLAALADAAREAGLQF